MLDLIEKIRQKPESTRYVIVLALFLFIAGLILLMSVWSASGRFTAEGIQQTWYETKTVAETWYGKFQNFRAKLGAVKKNLKEVLQPNIDVKKVLDSMSTYETVVNTDDLSSENIDGAVPAISVEEENAEYINIMPETESATP